KPKVDSSVVKLSLYSPAKYTPEQIEKTSKVIKAAFSMRRKTLVNTLMSLGGTQYDTKEKLTSLMTEMFGKPTVRGEELSTQQFVELAERLYQ
ncbi:MAG: 16S rRNA (adenine(1518)-N(6)/adenine(1519)-N(6))-dimethyltransferase, partial [Clostridia bacterium]|nr:16S rRNA (adenine(1518)-N(6)/adenine(1519)-N(6))-dimethyltransferase [Clostridia bacterium]